MGAVNYYEVLGIPPTATMEQVKAAYRRQALRYHPDKNPGSEDAAERFKICNDAYTVLSSDEKRSEFDRAQRASRGMGDVVGTLVDDLLGTRRKRRREGRDVRCDLTISLEEAAMGVSRRVHFTVPQTCSACAGIGAAPGGSKTCSACGGRGEVKDRPGLLSIPRPCARCGGQGISITNPCKTCGSLGTVERTREFLVKLPPGTRDGDVKIVDGQGEPGVDSGRPGDLHVVVTVEQDPLFRVDGVDLYLDLPVSFYTAAAGGTVDVPTLEGTVKMKVPPGTQSGRTFRLRHKGFPRGKLRGDQLVVVAVETPVGIGARQTQLLDQLEHSLEAGMMPLRETFARRVREREEQGKAGK